MTIAQTIQYYLKMKNYVTMAQKIITKYGLFDSAIIEEHVLKQKKYSDTKMLKSFLSKADKSFEKAIGILLREEVHSEESIALLLDHCLTYLAK